MVEAESVHAGPMPAPIVFFDIAGPDLQKQKAFYEAVFGWDVADEGRFAAPVAAPLPGLLRVEAGAGFQPERVLYAGVDDVTATLTKIAANGGDVVFPRMVVPGVVILALFTDPAGNRMGLVEMMDGKPIVPTAP
jgi:predicted enzyme related to lactoylglutathione lyase